MCKSLKVLLVSAGLLTIVGCTSPSGPIFAAITLNERGPVAGFNSTASATKVGRARAEGIILIGTGDASITAAARNGGITRIHHVDSESMNILGIYSRYETIVYGN
jgi:hypothetical protein